MSKVFYVTVEELVRYKVVYRVRADDEEQAKKKALKDDGEELRRHYIETYYDESEVVDIQEINRE